MQAIILAGGKGTRLRGVVDDIPKPMALVGNKPFLEYLILQLVSWGIIDIIMATGYRGETIKSYFGSGEHWGIRIQYSREKRPLGTGGALKLATEYLEEEDFILMNGDSFCDINFNEFIAYHNKSKGIGSIGLVYSMDTPRYGKVSVDESFRITSFMEKTPGGPGYINSGIYQFNKRVVEDIPSKKEVSLETKVLPYLLDEGLYGFKTASYFIDIGVPEDYLALCENPGQLFVTHKPL